MRPHTTVRGVRVYLYEHEAVCSAILAAEDFYEAAILDDLAKRYPTHATIVDVGAHIGNHTIYWSAFVPHDAIYAFEPVPTNYALLLANTADKPGVRTIRAALSDHDGVERMELDPVNMGRCRIDRDGPLPVAVMRLDDLDLVGVTLIKVDVEGHQAEVLAGARSTILRGRPVLLVEDGEGTAEDALAGLDYRLEASYPGSNDLWVPM